MAGWTWWGEMPCSYQGQCHKIFCFRFFSRIIFLRVPKNNVRVILNFSENSRRYSQVKVHHRYQWHRGQICRRCQLHWWRNCHRYQQYQRQIMPLVPLVLLISVANCHQCQHHRWKCWHIKVILKEKNYLYVNSTTQRCPKKIIKTFLIEDFFPFATGVVDTSGAPWTLKIFKKFEMALMI